MPASPPRLRPVIDVHVIDMGALPLTLLVTVLLAVVLIAVRVFVIQRAQHRRQRENRQASERLRYLVAAYRAMAGSFTRPTDKDWRQVEEALADVVLFGTLVQVKMAADCVKAILAEQPVEYQPLVDDLRADLREQLGLEAFPPELVIPPSGPGRPPRPALPGMGGGARRM